LHGWFCVDAPSTLIAVSTFICQRSSTTIWCRMGERGEFNSTPILFFLPE
jgi:hypothetical protein